MVDPVRNKKLKISADLQKANRISNGVDIEKLALLARIKLTPTEKEKLQKEFEDILNYVSQLKKADVHDVGEEKKINNVMREDEKQNEPGSFSEKLLNEAPFVEKGYVKVKHILE